MVEISRRKFITKITQGIIATLCLGACKPAPKVHGTPPSQSALPIKQTPTIPKNNSYTLTPPLTQTEDNGSLATFSPEIGPINQQNNDYPYIIVARNGDPEQLVNTAINAFGGIGRFVSPGDKVIVKPNICVAYHSYEYAATTNPWVVGALVSLCKKAGARSVKVMDSPFGGTAMEAYRRSGIEEQVKKSGGEMVLMSDYKYISTDIPEGIDLKKCDIYDDILKADVFINVPVAKTHGLTKLTLGMKNLLGVIKDRPSIHLNISQRIADLNSRLRPTLTIIDAVRILMDNGPTGGNLNDVKEMNTIIISADTVAADSYASHLFGMQPKDLGYINAAVSMKLGRSDLKNLQIEEINLNA